MSAGQDWHCDPTVHSNPSDINDSIIPSDDPLRPWKNHRVPQGSTVGSVLTQFSATAKHQFLKDVQTRSKAVGCTPKEGLAIHQGFLKATPIRSPASIGTLVESSFNKVFRTSIHKPLSTNIIKEARSGKSSKYAMTPSGEIRTLIKWQTRCGACSQGFKSGQRVVEMQSGEWRHYWLFPQYGSSFIEPFDTYRETCSDGTPMKDGGTVSMDLSGTLFSPV